MYKSRIRLDTLTDIHEFVSRMAQVPHEVFLTNGDRFTVSAKSLLGAMCTIEWDKIFVESATDLGVLIDRFRLLDSDK